MRYPQSIVLAGPCLDISGVAEVTRNLFFALIDLGINVRLADLPGWSHLKADLAPEKRDLLMAGLGNGNIQNPAVIHTYPPDPFKGMMGVDSPLQFTYTVFETDKCPLLWRGTLNDKKFMENWVPCDFQKDAYSRQGVDASKIRVIPYGVDVNRFKPGLTPLNYGLDDKFVIATAMDWGLRKNPEGIVNAFMQEFKDDQDVVLLIKAYTGYGVDDGSKNMIREKITRIRQMNRSSANVRLITDFLHADEMPHFHSAADVWINLSRGEGWDMGAMQSMACGIPVIMPDSTAHQMYGNKDNSYLVPVSKTPVSNKEFLAKNPQFIDHNWYEPNLKEAKKTMRQAYKDWKEGKLEEKGKAARQTACDFTWRRTAIKMAYEIGKYYQ